VVVVLEFRRDENPTFFNRISRTQPFAIALFGGLG